ncbi:hypothetical protein LPJ61_004470 [Coemansia biformis]|uniref:GH18 domain-containing protein n=1 Tax=Coemansia biformis TaxID=1286918 RepID=A0A9W7YAL4_9FUNG|nr:hypothetical protein LPJ61_004470 [Coemansia biformis]
MRLLILLLSSLLVARAAAEPVVLGYYPSWKRSKMDGVDFSKYTHVNIAFGIPRSDGVVTFEDDWAMPTITKQVRAGGAKVLLSVGGWTGSNYFSGILKDGSARERLLTSMVDYVRGNMLDGIDIDWEYPGRLGNACNVFDIQKDTPNFLAFLKDLRARFDSEFGARNKLITLAVRVEPFDLGSGPVSDVAEFAQYVDYANIMAYDINGGWNNDTGPNAPFDYEKGKGTPLSFVSAIDAWTKAGWPARQLVAGVGFYGRSTIAQQNMMRDGTNQYQPQQHEVPLGDPEDAPWYDACAQTMSASGTWQWKHLRNQGVLTDVRTAATPWQRYWDNVSQTPWLFNPTTKTFLSYDDPDSIRIKSSYAASRGLAGVMIWSANMDYNSELLDAARSFIANGGGGGGSGGTSNSSSGSANTASSSTSPPPAPATSTPQPATPSPSGPSSTASAEPATQSPQPAPDTEMGPTPGSACSNHGRYQCIDPSGRNAAYLVCVGGKQVPASCALGTVCLGFQSTIVCGWPVLRGLVEGVDSLLHAIY